MTPAVYTQKPDYIFSGSFCLAKRNINCIMAFISGMCTLGKTAERYIYIPSPHSIYIHLLIPYMKCLFLDLHDYSFDYGMAAMLYESKYSMSLKAYNLITIITINGLGISHYTQSGLHCILTYMYVLHKHNCMISCAFN